MNITSAGCPDIGTWRAWLDCEDEAPQLDEHLADCTACQDVVADLGQDAAQVRDAFAVLIPTSLPSAAEVAVARERLEFRRRGSLPTPLPVRSLEPSPMFFTRVTTPWRIAASGLAAALALSLLVAFTPEGQAAAAGFLAQFRSEQVSPIEVTPQTQSEIIRTLNSLGNLGTVTLPAGFSGRPQADLHEASSQAKTVTLAQASQAVGFPLETPDPARLPADIDKTPRVEVMPASQVRFTFDKAKAVSYFQSSGHPEVAVPDKFDGATLVVSIPSAALLQYGAAGGSTGRDVLMLGQAGELVVDVEGKVSLDEMRDFLLGLPGLPPTVVSQLRQIKSWNQTLPIPVPINQVHWQSTSFNGSQGLLLNDNSGVGSAAIWYAGGHMYGLAGSLKANDLKPIADSLAVR